MSSVPHIRPVPGERPLRDVISEWWEMHPDEDRIAVADWVLEVTGRHLGELFDEGDDHWFYGKLCEVMPEEDACSVYEGLEGGP
jgi:hypothetical protein